MYFFILKPNNKIKLGFFVNIIIFLVNLVLYYLIKTTFQNKHRNILLNKRYFINL